LTTTRNRRSLPERILPGILITLFAAIALITVWVFAAGRYENTAVNTRQTSGGSSSSVEAGLSVFTGIGRLRAMLAPSARQKSGSSGGGAAVVITIEFPYDDSDKPFFEELSLNVGRFRSVTLDYFASIPVDSPLLTGEPALKQALLSRYNALLYLGKINELYFSEFMLID
jgi:flagellar basal body-associated protein FliL